MRRREFLRVAVAGLVDAGASAPWLGRSWADDTDRRAVCDVRWFGATGNGRAMDAPAVNRTIAAAAAAGGGTVHFPAGTYVCHSIRLKSCHAPSCGGRNHSRGAHRRIRCGGAERAVRAVSGFRAQPVAQQPDLGRGPSRHCHRRIRPDLRPRAEPRHGWRARPAAGQRFGRGGQSGCAQVLPQRDAARRRYSCCGTFRHPGDRRVENLALENLRIDINRDGMNIDCCRNVRVSGCRVNSPGAAPA